MLSKFYDAAASAMIPVILLPGAGGDPPNPVMVRANASDPTRFVNIHYAGWRLYQTRGYTADRLVDDIVSQIETAVPEGPLRIVGLSIGGHFGYAAALKLQERGREINGFCAIDTYMMESAAPEAGWRTRAVTAASELLANRQFGAFAKFIRSRLWRAAVRVGDGRWLAFLPGGSSGSGGAGTLLDPMLEVELSMRLLIQMTAPFVVELDRQPRPLCAPSILLRTRSTGKDDQAWRARCPKLTIVELPGDHQSLFTDSGALLIQSAYLAATPSWR